MFTDQLKLSLFAGKGGDGIVSFRREKYIPKGGPTGGDGGNGGSIILEVDNNLFSLENLRHKRTIKALNGQNGGINKKRGKKGKDLILKIPPGTLVKDVKTKKILFDISKNSKPIQICRGGKGGKGNFNFKTPTNQAPNKCKMGTLGETKEIELELKLIADVGFVGFPNAGKSTLMSAITKANVKVAPYPFTTLRPNLGILEFDDFSKILIADIPGIIKGAHVNRGLGFSFLRHIERTSIIVFVIDISGMDGKDPFLNFKTLREELFKYSEEIFKKPFLVILNKIDEKISEKNLKDFKKKYPFERDILLEISALKKLNLKNFIKALQKLFKSKKH
jgi:GTP-binding protein